MEVATEVVVKVGTRTEIKIGMEVIGSCTVVAASWVAGCVTAVSHYVATVTREQRRNSQNTTIRMRTTALCIDLDDSHCP